MVSEADLIEDEDACHPAVPLSERINRKNEKTHHNCSHGDTNHWVNIRSHRPEKPQPVNQASSDKPPAGDSNQNNAQLNAIPNALASN